MPAAQSNAMLSPFEVILTDHRRHPVGRRPSGYLLRVEGQVRGPPRPPSSYPPKGAPTLPFLAKCLGRVAELARNPANGVEDGTAVRKGAADFGKLSTVNIVH